VLNAAFAINGTSTTVDAGGGPLALAGSVNEAHATISKVGPGFNINHLVVGGASAVKPASTRVANAEASARSTKPVAAAARSTRK
jgi:hypothetical protein